MVTAGHADARSVRQNSTTDAISGHGFWRPTPARRRLLCRVLENAFERYKRRRLTAEEAGGTVGKIMPDYRSLSFAMRRMGLRAYATGGRDQHESLSECRLFSGSSSDSRSWRAGTITLRYKLSSRESPVSLRNRRGASCPRGRIVDSASTHNTHYATGRVRSDGVAAGAQTGQSGSRATGRNRPSFSDQSRGFIERCESAD